MVATILIREIPFESNDDRTQRMLRDCIPSAVKIHSIDIRSTKVSRTRVAYVHFMGSQYTSELLDIFNTTLIFGVNLRAHPFATSKLKRFDGLPDFRASPYQDDYEPTPFSSLPYNYPTSRRSSDSTLRQSSRDRTLAQLFIFPLISNSEWDIQAALQEILYKHFKNKGTIILKGNLDSLTAFVNIYNHSDDSIPLIMERMSKETIGTQILNVSIQTSPRASTNQELEEQIKWENAQDQTLVNKNTVSLSSNQNEVIKLHVAPFPLLMEEDEIRSRLSSILLEAFYSDPTSVILVQSRSQDYTMAFVDVVNRSNRSPSIIVDSLPSIPLGGKFTLRFNFQKGFQCSSEQEANRSLDQSINYGPSCAVNKEENEFEGKSKNLVVEFVFRPNLDAYFFQL